MMRRPTSARHGLLALVAERTAHVPYFTVFASTSDEAHRYGLSGDTIQRVINAAVAAGLLSVHKGMFYLLTEEGRAILDRYPFAMHCAIGRPCQLCIRLTGDL
jgi:hypothetical protein